MSTMTQLSNPLLRLSALVLLTSALLIPDVSAQQAVLGENWQQLPGRAKDIGGGADGSVWIIGENESIYRWNEDGYAWERASGTAVRIAVLADGTPVVVNKKDEIYKRRGGNWQQLPGRARDIGAGADGSLWIIGDNKGIYQWNEDAYAWERVKGEAVRIAVMASGTPVVVNDKEEIYMRRGGNWQQLPGRAKDISAGADGSLWIIGENRSPYEWDDDAFSWRRMRGSGSQIAVSGNGQPYLVNSKEEVYRIAVKDVVWMDD